MITLIALICLGQVTKQWVTPTYPETNGPIVHATEVNGVLETEGQVAVANADLDRYNAFHRCYKGPKWLIVRFNDAIYFTRRGGILMWPTITENGWQYWSLRTVQSDCDWWDYDDDNDVDLRDFARFQKDG